MRLFEVDLFVATQTVAQQLGSTGNDNTASTQISVDRATLASIQNENGTLHKLVIKLQASNIQLQNQLLDKLVILILIILINKNLNNTNAHGKMGHSSKASSPPTKGTT